MLHASQLGQRYRIILDDNVSVQVCETENDKSECEASRSIDLHLLRNALDIQLCLISRRLYRYLLYLGIRSDETLEVRGQSALKQGSLYQSDQQTLTVCQKVIEIECKCLTHNQKPTGSRFNLLHELNLKVKGKN